MEGGCTCRQGHYSPCTLSYPRAISDIAGAYYHLSFRSKRLQHGALHWQRREYVVVKMRRHDGRYVRDD